MISGIATALKERGVKAKVVGVEPKNAQKLTAALQAKKAVRVRSQPSLADGLMPRALGAIAYRVCSKYVDSAVSVTEEEILAATKAMVNTARIPAEPSGATPLAPLLSKAPGLGGRVVLVVSGGNISLELLKRILEP